ncbi:MAG: prepilin-type N-terminal cleavage/methylation domain-containing protein [Candidatus Omnitrophota bacterium]
MEPRLLSKKGFTLIEVLFVAIITVMVVSTILSAWIFTQKTWSGERYQTFLRVDMLKSMETIKSDLRLSSTSYMSFYPMTSGVYTAMSMPQAECDRDGFFTMDSEGKIAWDKTIIYHIVTDGDEKHLCRTVIDSWDDDLDQDGRYNLLEDVVSGDDTGDSYKYLMKSYLDRFEIEPSAPLIEFYTDSAEPVKSRNVVFGYAELSPGSHTIEFTVMGKNQSSGGYAFGIDSISIDPCGSYRDAEYYDSSFAPGGALTTSGNSINIYNDSIWRNQNYLEYAASGEGSFLEITDGYDLWRDSVFESASKNNTRLGGQQSYLRVETLEDREEMGKDDIVWQAFSEADDSVVEGRDAELPGYPITVRTVVSNANIDTEGVTSADPVRSDVVRVKFKSSSSNPFMMSAAYITRRSSGMNGEGNQSTGGLLISEYHRHQQLFFKDTHDMDADGSVTDIVEYLYIPPDSEAWSEWTAFPLALSDDDGTLYHYLITFCVPDLETVPFPSGWDGFDPMSDNCKDWEGLSTHTYYITEGDYAAVLLPAAGTPVWSSVYTTVQSDSNVYVSAEIDGWRKSGTVESKIFNTQTSSPSYNDLKWSASKPVGANMGFKARSSDSEAMAGAADWDNITGSGANPQSLGIGAGKYVQYKAELSSDLYWQASGNTLSYADYVDAQVAAAAYSFPVSSGEYMVTGVYSSGWIDDVEIDWQGDTRICVIKGDIAKKNDYGQVTVTIDGVELIKVLKVDIRAAVDFHGRVLEEANILEIEPRNTGR